MEYKKLKQEALGKYCRECINRAYHVNLKRENCFYIRYPARCAYCETVKNIVEDVGMIGRIRIFFA